MLARSNVKSRRALVLFAEPEEKEKGFDYYNTYNRRIFMIITLFTYILLGLSLAIPAGAMTVQMTKQGMRNGFVHGWFVGIGGMTVDLSLIVLIYLGFSSVLTNPWVETVMWLLGFIFLMFIGIESIKEAKSEVNIDGEDPNKSLLSAYLSGFMIAISPANIVFWIGVFGPVLVSSLGNASTSTFILIAVGILLGIFMHDMILLSFVHFTRRFLNPTFIKRVSIFAAIVLFGFSGYFGYEFIKELYNVSK